MQFRETESGDMNKLISKPISARDECGEENETGGVERLRKDEGVALLELGRSGEASLRR